ncbi:hypothetical protein ACFLVM_01350 [Chloroflexota bacterium]
MPIKADKEIVRAPLLRSVGDIAKLVVEHGIPRVLVATGVAILLSILIKEPPADWRTIVVPLAIALSAIVIGALTRIFEMKYGVFSGRTTILRCRNCGEAITSGAVALGNKPPQLIQCNHCQAVNIIQ